ncbi:MAG: hypothetical protein IT389_09025 [Nitrospira sp.]|nr:hypothetical protein [Nitrospira sp.]
MDRKDIAIAVLTALGIQELEYALDGGGDSGDSTLERIQHVDGRTLEKLPNIPIGILGGGWPYTLEALLDDLVADLPEGDWINNEGGYGTVIIRPFEDEEDLCFDCDMTYRDEGDYGGDDAEFVDEDEDDDAAFEDQGVSP